LTELDIEGEEGLQGYKVVNKEEEEEDDEEEDRTEDEGLVSSQNMEHSVNIVPPQH
jgi:hypothetical protein